MSREEIVKHKNFEVICKAVKTGLRLWSPNNQIEILKIILYFGVPETSIMVQSVLHLLKKEVNELNISEIIFLHMLCRKSKSDANLKALEISLPLVFEANLKLKLLRDHAGHLAEALDYASKFKMSEETYDTLLTEASKHTIEDPRDAFKIAVATSKIKLPHPLKAKLCYDALDVVMKTNNFVKYSDKDLTVLLDYVTSSCKRDRGFFHEKFFDGYVESLITNKGNLYRAIRTADKLIKAVIFFCTRDIF